MPRISVIIPTFNCAEYLSSALDSVLAQTMDDYDIVVIDDGSSDNTKQALLRYRENSKVTYIYQENRGLPGARNAGVAQSDSEYLAFLDADDQLRPDALQQMTEAVSNMTASWCLVDILKCKPEGKEVQHTVIPEGNLYYGILRDDFIRRGMFFRRDSFLSVGMYDEQMKYREDWDLNIRMFEKGFPYSYIPEPLYLYTWREGSITTGKRAQVMAFTEMLLRKHHKARADEGDKVASEIYSHAMWGLSRDCLYEVRDYQWAMRCACESVRYDFKPARLLHPVAYQLQRLGHQIAELSGM